MSQRLAKRVKSQFGGSYRDRIPLDDDFDIVKARTEAISGPTYLPAQAGRSVWSSSWTIGASWAPEESFEFSLDPDHAQYDAVVDADLADVMDELVAPKKKGKRSQASVCRRFFQVFAVSFSVSMQARPNVFWKHNARQLYLEELLRHEGRGDFARDADCPDCLSRGSKKPGPALFRCTDCFLPDLTCSGCLIRRHRLNPFHNVEVIIYLFICHRRSDFSLLSQEWHGSFFKRTTLKDVGLVIHLNHASMKCPTPAPCDERLRVIHTTGVHEVTFSYCACNREIPRDVQLLRRGLYPAGQQKVRTCVTFALLKLFHLFSLMGKVSVYDMYRSIERLTDNTGIHMPPSRYTPTMRCLTQWRHLKALKRGGRGHDTEGAAGTLDGGLAIICPSCPRPGINLPRGWKSEPKEKQYVSSIYSHCGSNGP